MRFTSLFVRRICAGLLFCCSAFTVPAQSYKSLLWEITGNGLKKPSYLFGTMHISNKMVFHLSDSFYAAIRSADVVAIELNPEQWQSEMPRMNKQGELYKYYNATYYTDYLKEQSFTEDNFLEPLLASLRFEPAINDALLYRNESRMDNFQEDTYLDLYIYQTGKKLGKQTAGVETFMGSQRMLMEAMIDAAAETKPQRSNEDADAYELGQSLQDAYRRGDLDMLDSLNKVTEYTQSFTEKFLYRRNEMQAASMDSIMKQKSLFVGVGAAHLPGRRGVIELLRKKGYTLRPLPMLDRDASQKRYIDSLTVPVQFVRQYAADSMYSVSVPGRLNDIESRGNMSLKHYADMGNGSYYLVTRIKTNMLFNSYSPQRMLKMVDSLLYENVPGTILSSKSITNSGYPGIDIINRTRKGDLQHYQLMITPSELFVFKMGGKGNYVDGKEAGEFFGSISLRTAAGGWQTFTPASGGFSVDMPETPRTFFNADGSDRLPEWKYEATDPATGEKYGVIRKSIYSFDFIEPDTFDLMLMAESFGSSDQWEEGPKAGRMAKHGGRAVRDLAFRAKDGDYIEARVVLFGPQYYLLVHRSQHKSSKAGAFFNSFRFVPFRYPGPQVFSDTTLRFSVNSCVRPVIDPDIADMMSYVKQKEPLLRKEVTYNNEPENHYANFVSEETGEVIVVNHYEFPSYFYIKDSAAFWNNQFSPDSSLMLRHKQQLSRGQGVQAWLLEWADTGSTRLIRKLILQKDMDMVTATTMRDSTLPLSSFLDSFYGTLALGSNGTPGSLYHGKQEQYFQDYYSSDTLRSKKARAALSSVYFGKEGYPQLLAALAKLNHREKDYYDMKTGIIAEIGAIGDSTIKPAITTQLKQIYLAAGDTTLFQNSVLKALAALATPAATDSFRNLILQDPPAFDESYEYAGLFGVYSDSLKLAARLFPGIMSLTAVEDFKAPVRELLVSLLDSGYVQPSDYDDFAGNIYFDAKIALKKLQYSSESMQGKGDDDVAETYSRERVYGTEGRSDAYGATDMLTYVKLLAPFYRKNPNLPKFFDKLLQLGNRQIRLNTALALLRQGQPVADSIWTALAEEKGYRNYLWSQLKAAGQEQFFPQKYRRPEAVAAGLLYASYGSMLDSLQPLDHAPIVQKEKAITSYFYKYKQKRSDDWKLAISSVRQSKGKPVEGYAYLMQLSDKKLAATAPAIDRQIEAQFRKLTISRSNSGNHFYNSSQYNSNYGASPPVAD
ncbi:TraB/GumN family protein [Taibaiella koreensis]|uniref:TraB/GumN family protein n=1 Tax=Taibaiella koreensis TaxID=1268548 RepID=UPI000E59DFCA|nr:TraB/GumN family protein [Taibaiella koreensis]